jgi:hypothetical protein
MKVYVLTAMLIVDRRSLIIGVYASHEAAERKQKSCGELWKSWIFTISETELHQ